jgi:hypothetical protein
MADGGRPRSSDSEGELGEGFGRAAAGAVGADQHRVALPAAAGVIFGY